MDFTNTAERSQVGYWIAKRAHISFPASGNELLFTVMVLSVSADAFFAFTSAYDLKQPLPSTSSLLAVHSTCPQTVSALAHNVSGVRLGTGLGSVYFNR